MKQSEFVKLATVLLGLALLIAEGVNYSQIGPFFPTEAAEHKGISTTSIGIITGSFDVANLFAAFILASFISPKNQKHFFCIGALMSATSNGLFGIMGFSKGGISFITLCTLLRVLMGTGASMVYSTGLPLLVPLYPEWSGRITTLFETSLGLGIMLGPLLGCLLFSIGGYVTPFTFAACCQILMVIICVLFLPNKAVEKDRPFGSKSLLNDPNTHEEAEAKLLDPNDGETELPGFTLVYFATRPAVIAVGLTLAFHSATTGFIDVALAAYLLEKFSVEGDSSGFYFLSFLGVNVMFFPFLGWLVDRGQAGRIFLIACLAGSLGLSGLSLPCAIRAIETKNWVILWLSELGAANAGGYASVYLLFEKLAYIVGFRIESNIKLIAASLSNACFASGRLFGSIIVGGIFMDRYGYYYSCLLLSCLFLISFFPCCYVLFTKKLLRKIYFFIPESKILI
ncbi:MFS-type transporter SLC18B1-like [Convolutriloba macropyga]|uniref:MFS-type transporter SLC18B1-like n=1 Tax=Convolutriloba macropyga TaxID=536237 RepID=UPI003F523239